MKNILVIRKNTYFDSVTLMSLSEELKKLDEAENVMVTMATAMNKELLQKEQLADASIEACTENDLVIAAKVSDEVEEEDFIGLVDEKLKGDKASGEKEEEVYATIKQAKAADEDANMVVISVPGEHAAREAKIALENGQNGVGELLRQAAERKIPLLDIIKAYNDKDYLETLYQRALECLKDKELYDEWCALSVAYYSGGDPNKPRVK